MDGQAIPSGAAGSVPFTTEPPPPAEEVLPDAAATASADEVAGGGVVLTDELRDQIVKQVEYYFSDENLPTDEFLLKFVKKNKERFVPIGLIASFRRMNKLVQDLSVIEAALRTSSKLVVSSDGKRVRRLHPLPHNEWKDVKKQTVIVENLPPDFSMESIERTFGRVGKITKITIHDPHSVGGSVPARKPDFVSSSKVHALVEYEAVEAAEKAVATLNYEKNWRTGMRVRLLAKRSVIRSAKQNQSLKKDQKTNSKTNIDADSGESGLDRENVKSIGPNEMDDEQRPNIRGRKSWYKGQGKGQIQLITGGQGNVPLPGSRSKSISKSIPGPRMPDGTRGFTVGRGRSLPLQKADKTEE